MDKGSDLKKTHPTSMPFIKNFFFVFVFILSFALIKQSDTEMLGLGLFFAINMLYCIGTSSDVLKQLRSGSDEQKWRGFTLLIVMTFSFVSTILLAMTMSKIQNTFVKKERIVRLSDNDSRNLDAAETIFITITVFMWVMALYTFQSSEKINKTLFLIGNSILHGTEMQWIRVLFSVAAISVGSALYGQLDREKILVDNNPEVWCDPNSEGKSNGVSMSLFKSDFITSYWFLFAFILMKLLRPFIESNRIPVFQKNGFGYLNSWFGDSLSFKDPHFATNRMTPIWDWLTSSDFMKIFSLRWYTIYVLGTWAFGLSALVYASYSIRDFQQLVSHDCMMNYAYIKQLFIAFVFFLICLYTVNVLTAYQFTKLLTNIMQYLVPPTALALSSYLVYLTNSMSQLAAHQIIE